MDEKFGLSFTDKKHTERGIFSTVLAVLSAVTFVALVIISYRNHGNAGMQIGSAGLTAMVASVIGMTSGLLSFKEQECNYLFSKIGTLLNLVLLVGWLFIFMIGFYG